MAVLWEETCTELSRAGGKEVHKWQQGQQELLISHCGLHNLCSTFPTCYC